MFLKKPETDQQAVSFLKSCFQTAVEQAMPHHCLPPHLPPPPKGRTLIIAIGKAAASMAQAAEQAIAKQWPKEARLSGIALTRYGHGCSCDKVEVVEASHPVPDDRGSHITHQIMQQVKALTQDDLLLFLVSGGGSALMNMPIEGISLDEKKQINKALLMSGAPIHEMNIVRKHLSAVKGGRLAQMAAPASIVSLAISDVPHDEPSTIASGPTVADPSTAQQARAIINRYGITCPSSIDDLLHSQDCETPSADDPCFNKASFTLIARPTEMIENMAMQLNKRGFKLRSLGANIEGEAQRVAQEHAKIIRMDNDIDLLLSGGETTVTVTHHIKAGKGGKTGKGGRNCEYLLALALALNGEKGIYALAADTDGIDGSETNAGALITPDTLSRGVALGLDAQDYLHRHDSFSYFEALGDLITTGPTRTNVNDFRLILLAPAKCSPIVG